jgi:hypothetical protein
LSNLYESRNEWSARLISIFTPLIAEGIHSLLNESVRLCLDNNEPVKYLMTFQNLLSRIPKWNSNIVEEERKRIIEKSGCNYLEDLITCVHIIQLKVLTCIRVGNRQKKIDISIPKLDAFIHKIYIHAARKLYQNVYLFDKAAIPLQVQRNGREIETIIQECILSTIRDSIPTEDIIRAYMDESMEHEEEITVETLPEEPSVPENVNKSDSVQSNTSIVEPDLNIPLEMVLPPEEPPLPIVPSVKNIDNEEVVTRLSFNDFDSVLDHSDNVNDVSAPKSFERLDEISNSRALQRKIEEEEESSGERIQIYSDNIALDSLDTFDLDI